ncbi:transglutaminase family protein [Dissulfurispira sp.]|uniref:transglutaminase family protein n=1 Tax=Dissulfurispira sp. TaxID=2817609 RepID=UPI002FDAB6FD
MKSSSKIKIEVIVKIITYIIGLIGFLSVFKHISFIYSAAFIVLCLLAVYFDYKKSFHMPRWFLNLTALAVILLSLFRLSLDNPVVSAVEGLLILLSIKFLEEKKFRDYMQIYLISLFLLSGSALLTIDIEFSIYFLIMIFMLAISIVLLTYYSQEPDLELPKSTIIKIALKSLLIPLISMPMTLFLFVMLPRTSYPFFNFLNRAEKAKTGFTDNVRLGSVSGIQEDATAIFRAHMEKIDERHLYWRGIVLDYFDGASWKSTDGVRGGDEISTLILKGEKVRQTIYLEPYEHRYIFALDKPYLITLNDIKKYGDLTFSLSKEVDKRIRYDVVSILSDAISEIDIDKERYLQLPENISSEIMDIVKGLTSGRNSKEENIKSVLTFLKGGNYKYSLQNLPVSKTPLEDFLFKYKHGNCEYFASAMAVMLRISGVPARLVGGYRGGYYNDIGKYYLVPQKNAHVWVEAYTDKGWIRLDPTPASIEGFVSPHKRDILFKIRLVLDTINYYWNAFVISYDFEKQLSLFHKIQSGIRKPEIKLSINKEKLIKYLVIPAVLSLSVFMLYVLISSRKTEEERLIALFLKKMERHGYKKGKSEGLEEFVAGIREEELKQLAYRFVEEFESHYYKDRKFTKEEINRLKSMLK